MPGAPSPGPKLKPFQSCPHLHSDLRTDLMNSERKDFDCYQVRTVLKSWNSGARRYLRTCHSYFHSWALKILETPYHSAGWELKVIRRVHPCPPGAHTPEGRGKLQVWGYLVIMKYSSRLPLEILERMRTFLSRGTVSWLVQVRESLTHSVFIALWPSSSTSAYLTLTHYSKDTRVERKPWAYVWSFCLPTIWLLGHGFACWIMKTIHFQS